MKIEGLSWRHHYLPEFYLKGFTNELGKFKIYDVVREKFVRNGKDFPPSSYFFDQKGNTIIGDDGVESDKIEKVYYKRYDDWFSEILNNIKKNGNHNLTPNENAKILLCIGVLFWRGSQGKYKINDIRLKEFYYLTINKKTGIEIDDSEFEKWLISNSNAQKYLKLTTPLVGYQETFGSSKLLKLKVFKIGDLPSICSDSPIIFLNESQSNPYVDNFIFPLTNTIILFHGNMKSNIDCTIKLEIDLILLKQATKYVSCTDMNYIHVLNKYFESNCFILNDLRAKIFEEVFN